MGLLWLVLGTGLGWGAESAPSADVSSCADDQAATCVSEGKRYFVGDGVPKDPFRAAQLWRRACDAGYAPGCMFLAESYRNGEGLGVNSDKAFDLYVAACELGQPVACRSVGDLMILNVGSGFTGDDAGVWYALGCDLGDGQGCTAAGLWFERVGPSTGPDPAKARALFAAGCNRGHARGCTLLVIRHDKGLEGAKRDRDEATMWFAKGCTSSPIDGEACRELGWTMYKAKGDDTETVAGALLSLDKACYAGDSIGCRYLATAQQREGDLAEALMAGQRGCDLGDGAACTRAERVQLLMTARRR